MYLQTKDSKKNYLIYIYFFTVFLSFVFGFFFNEDSSGGGLVDFEHEWTSINEFKLGIFSALTSDNYESSRTPLFLVLNYYNPFNDTEFNYRISNFIFNLFIPISFFIFLKNKYENLNLIVAVTLLLYLSPYFRTSSYWAHQENLPILFTICSFLYLNLYESNKIKKNSMHIFCIALVSSLAFYSDQKYIFVSLYCFIKLIIFYRSEQRKILLTIFFFFISSLPTFYLFYLWKGILPIESQFRLGFYPQNISLSVSIICFYFLPIFAYLILNNKLFEILQSIKKIDYIFILLLTIIFILCMPNFENPWGGGVVYKLFYLLNLFIESEIICKFVFFAFIITLTVFIYLLLKNNLLNFFPLIILIILSSFVEKTYQEYFDPIIIVLLFSYFQFEKKFVDIMSKKIVFNLSLFFIFFLIFANIYYIHFNLVK